MKWPPLSHCAVSCGRYVDHICFSRAAPERELRLASSGTRLPSCPRRRSAAPVTMRRGGGVAAERPSLRPDGGGVGGVGRGGEGTRHQADHQRGLSPRIDSVVDARKKAQHWQIRELRSFFIFLSDRS